MVHSGEILEKLEKTLPEEIWSTIESAIPELHQKTHRKSQKKLLHEINKIIFESAIKTNNPAFLNILPDLTDDDYDSRFKQILQQYISSKDDQWLNAIFILSEKMGKKSDQARVFAKIARDLIDTGVSSSNAKFIEEGMEVLQRISFRKYRSEIMIDIIPLLIVWAITTRSKDLIYTSLELIEEIGDISKRAVLHSELAKALATIAILDKDRTSFFDSINRATLIHQKNRRHDCLVFIIERGSKSVFGKEMADIPHFIINFQAAPREAYLEIISALTEQILDRIKDKKYILQTLQSLCRTDSGITEILVLDLLKKAERSGDLWYFSSAMDLQTHLDTSHRYPYREMVRAGISVAKKTKEMKVLLDLIPVIEENADPTTSSRIYLQLSETMLYFGDFGSALILFKKIRRDMETSPAYTDALTQLIQLGILNNQVLILSSSILQDCSQKVVHTTVSRAIIDLCKETPLENIRSYISPINEILALHPQKDQIVLDCIAMLVERGFLDSGDPGVLIHFAESITDRSMREKAISLIVIKIARIGVHARNRDMLQRAVGLSCAIEGQNTRSAALSSIIDEAAILAAQQGDLDLLLRMKVWSSSLLDPNLATLALSNIIDGIIKYALNQQSVAALEEATRIAGEINDPSLRKQSLEKIAEGLVTTGCILLHDPFYLIHENRLSSIIYPFEYALEITRTNSKSSQVSLKIASFIDIILSYSQSSENPDYTIMLALYASEITNSYEQDAMMARIVSCLRDNIPHPDSTDPYDVMTIHILRNDLGTSNPIVLDLLQRIIVKINDRFTRLSRLCNLAVAMIKNNDVDHARQLLDIINDDYQNLSVAYQKVLILTDLTTVYVKFDPNMASHHIETGISLLEHVDPEHSSEVCRQIVLSIVRLNSTVPDKKWTRVALEIIGKISSPAEYINSLVAVYNMFTDNKAQCNDLLITMAEAVENIRSPYDQSTIMIDLITLALENENTDLVKQLLTRTESASRRINIQYMADMIKVNISQIYLLLFKKYHDDESLDKAVQVIRTIYNDEVRIHQFQVAGQDDASDDTARYLKIKNTAEKLMRDTTPSNQITSLEIMVRSITDRGKEALYFCDLAIFFKRGGNGKLSQKMIQSAINEAKIIRPLSRRSHILCDIALKLYASGNQEPAQEILDYAVDAATNIRQASVRDDVFEELSLAIKIMQGL